MKITEHFSWEEFADKNNENLPVPDKYRGNVEKLCRQLEIIREKAGNLPVVILLGYCANEQTQHLYGKAADLQIVGLSAKQVHALISQLIREQLIEDGGVGLYDDFVHYDIRGCRAQWDKRKGKNR